MATDTARRHYWQLPTFALGVAAAIAAWMAFPPPTLNSAERYGHDLAALKHALDRKPADAAVIANLAPKVGADADRFPDTTTTAHYLAGSGYAILAETNPEHWPTAATHLAKADAAKLPDADQQRLTYRRAKAEAATGTGNPATLVAALTKPPTGEDDGERRRLLADAYLRSTPPNLKGAKDEIDSYLSGPTKLPPTALAAYRYKLGEIHVKLNEPEAARKILQAVGANASADVQAAAKLQLAKLAVAENNWLEAVRLYEEARSSPGLPKEQHREVAFQLGVGMLHLKNPTAAATHFLQAYAEPGAVGAAAAVRLAELTAREPAQRGTRVKAVEYLEAVVKDMPTGSAFRNPHVNAMDVQAAFEEVIQVCLNEAEYPTAVRAAGSYAKVAPAGRDLEKRAEANAAWGTALQAGAATATLAAEKFKAAATDYSALAKSHPTATGKADFLRRAATCLRQSGDKAAAFAALDELTRTPGLPDESVAAVCVERGDLHLTTNQFKEAVEAYQKAMTFAAPSATVARTRLGVAHLEQAKQKPAESAGMRELGHQLLTQVANSTGDSPLEKEARQQALFELGKSLFVQQKVTDAEARFRQLIQNHPTGTMVGHAKLYLGSCLWAAADNGPAGQPPIDRDTKLAEAYKLFESLSDSPDMYLRTQADIRLVNTAYLMRKFDEMPALCEKLTKRYPGTVEELIVQCLLFNAYIAAERPALAQQVLTRMELAFAQLPKEKFTGGSDEYKREFWANWFEEMKKKK